MKLYFSLLPVLLKSFKELFFDRTFIIIYIIKNTISLCKIRLVPKIVYCRNILYIVYKIGLYYCSRIYWKRKINNKKMFAYNYIRPCAVIYINNYSLMIINLMLYFEHCLRYKYWQCSNFFQRIFIIIPLISIFAIVYNLYHMLYSAQTAEGNVKKLTKLFPYTEYNVLITTIITTVIRSDQ